LTLLPEDVSQRKYPLREVVNGLRYIVKTGAHWRMMPHDFPPWPVGDQQMLRWLAAACFEAVVHDLRVLLRRAAGRAASHGWGLDYHYHRLCGRRRRGGGHYRLGNHPH
jgi:transposase